jgi:hypothetical protein
MWNGRYPVERVCITDNDLTHGGGDILEGEGAPMEGMLVVDLVPQHVVGSMVPTQELYHSDIVTKGCAYSELLGTEL